METLKDIFVSKEIAKKLKAIGFSEPCISYYLDGETYKRLYITNVENDENFTALGDTLVIDNHNKENDLISSPTYEQVFKWFRDRGMNSVISYNNSEKHVEEYDTMIWDNKGWTFNPLLSFKITKPHGYSMKNNIHKEIRDALILKLIEIYEKGK